MGGRVGGHAGGASAPTGGSDDGRMLDGWVGGRALGASACIIGPDDGRMVE